jgi:adenosine kinase
LKNASYVYTTGFFITSNFDALIMAGEFCAEHGIPFGFNLSAEFLIQFFTEQVVKAIELADYVFCNEDELKCIAEKFEEIDIMEHIAKMKKVGADKKPIRVVISTQGPCATRIATMDHALYQCEYHTVEVPELDSEKIIDTNGAGDAFVGGFYAALLNGKEVDQAVEAGNKLAACVVQNSGCKFEGWNVEEKTEDQGSLF